MAYELISGRLTRPILEYQADHYSGGSLVVGLLAMPFFLLFGTSAFTLELVALIFFTVALIVWILFCLRFFNYRTAIFFSILYIFSPVLFTEMSLITMGFHSESILFTAVTIFIFYEIFFGQKRRWPYFIALGLVCGFGLWFTYIFGITLMCCLLCWFLFDKKFLLRKDFWIFSLGFLLGFSPWIYYNLKYHFQGLYICETHLSNFFALSNFLKIFDLKRSVIRFILASLYSNKIWIFYRISLSLVYFLTFITAFLSILWNGRKNLLVSKEFLFILYCFAICITFQLAITKHTIYLIPLHPFIFITIALFLNRLFETKIRFKMVTSYCLLFSLALISFSDNINIVSTSIRRLWS